jgi:hypothetical protein
MLPRLTNAVQVRQLAPSEAERGYFASLRGVSTFYHSGENELILQDGSGGVVVRTGNSGFELGVGQLLEVEGTTQRGPWSAELRASRVTLIGEAPLPPLHRLNEAELSVSQPECCWVEITGVVYSLEIGRPDGLLGLEVATWSNRVIALIKQYRLEECRELVDGEVAIAGVLRRTQTGPSIRVPSMSDITVTKRAPPNPFEAPLVSACDLLGTAQAGCAIHRVRVCGVVTLQQPGRAVFIQQNTNGLLAFTEQTTTVLIGDFIELAGFPLVNGPFPEVEHAVFRRLRSGPLPVPTPISAEEGALPCRGAALVNIEGWLLRRERTLVPALYLQSSNIVFSARLQDGVRDFPREIREGSRLRLTGICLPVSGRVTNSHTSFELLLRSPVDVTLAESTARLNDNWLKTGVLMPIVAVLVLCIGPILLHWCRRVRR